LETLAETAVPVSPELSTSMVATSPEPFGKAAGMDVNVIVHSRP
jgi:hypothetical protein